jgi:hypothetical protein
VEVDNSRLVIDEEYREIAKGKLLAQQYAILLKLNEITAAAWEIESIDNENILQCFIEWVTVRYNPDVLNSLPNHYAMNKLFEYVQDERRTNETPDCIKRLILHLANPADVPVFYEYLAKKVVELLSVVNYFIEQAELTEAEDYLRLIVEFCRKSVPTFVANFDERVNLFLRTLAKYTQDEIVEVYDSLVEFWEELIAEAALQKAVRALSPQLTALIEEVYLSVCEKCHYSLKVILDLDSRPESKLYEFNRSADDIRTRRDNSDSIFEKIAEFYGKTAYLQMVYGKIQAVSQKADQFLWPYLEIYLFSLVDAVKKVERFTAEVSNIVSIYVELAGKANFSTPIILRKTFLSLFKSLMSIQEKDVGFIKLLFNLTSTCFDNELLMPHAERTFAKGCQHNHEIMRENTEDMMQLVQKYPHREYIVKGVTQLLCRYEEATLKYLPSILSYLFTRLQEAGEDRYLAKELMYSLTGIMKVLLEVVPDKPAYVALVGGFTRIAFPFILETVRCPKRVQNDEDAEVERMVKLIKIIMRYLKFSFTEFIEPLYSAVLEAYPRYPICSYAYLLEIAITVFYENQQYTDYFRAVFVKFCEITFVHMNQVEKMEKYSYLLDDFIGISKRFFVYNASILLNSGQLPNLIQLCTSAFIGSETPRIARAAYTFFETIFMVYWRQEFVDDYNSEMTGEREKFTRKTEDEPLYFQLKNLLVEKLDHIVTKILEHLSLVPSESTREQILFVLLSEIKAFPQENMAIWPKIFARLPADILVANEKARFKANLDLLASADFAQVREAARFIKRYVYLMNKRMINANNRRFKL